eukprot:1456239-Rhodomonas_salina.1
MYPLFLSQSHTAFLSLPLLFSSALSLHAFLSTPPVLLSPPLPSSLPSSSAPPPPLSLPPILSLSIFLATSPLPPGQQTTCVEIPSRSPPPSTPSAPG